jgi:hypothetical protein
MTLSPSSLAELKAKAQKATKGPFQLWKPQHPDKYPEPHAGDSRLLDANNICIGILFGGYATLPQLEPTQEFLAACSPDVVIGLVDEIERLRSIGTLRSASHD